MEMSPSWVRVTSSLAPVMGSCGPVERARLVHALPQMVVLLGRVSSFYLCHCFLSYASLDPDSATQILATCRDVNSLVEPHV